MSDGVMIAIISGVVALFGVLGPILSIMASGWLSRAERREDYARQDAVAANAREAARLLAVQNRVVNDAATATSAQLDTIHKLVNSNMSAVMQSEHEARAGQLATMRELVALQRANGIEPSTETLTMIETLKQRVAEIGAALAERRGEQGA